MRVLKTIKETNEYLKTIWKDKIISLVPTMGALHEGHGELIKEARKVSDIVIVSVFVNPTQFGPNEDFSRYPRTEESDIRLCASLGADAVFLPPVEQMYPSGPVYSLVPPEHLSKKLCGLYRDNHFAGVCTVVAKLFNIISPNKAFFGLKDYQQYAILKNMAAYMSYNIEINGVETVREESGLALSSRNKYLTETERGLSVSIYNGLIHGKNLYTGGIRERGVIEAAVSGIISGSGLTPQYVTLLQADTLTDEINWDKPVVVAVAAYTPQSNTRLIDNMVYGG